MILEVYWESAKPSRQSGYMVAAATRFSRNFVAQTSQFDGPEFHLKVAFYIILGAKNTFSFI